MPLTCADFTDHYILANLSTFARAPPKQQGLYIWSYSRSRFYTVEGNLKGQPNEREILERTEEV